MEAKHRNDAGALWKMVVFLLFGLLIATEAEGQASVTVSPSGTTNVSNGGTVTITATAYLSLGVLSSAGWSYSGKWWPTNATCTTTGGGILNVDSTISSTLTITNFSSASAGTYTFSISGGVLFIVNASQSVTLGVTPIVTGVTSGSAMVKKGFKIQFSGPTGSNLVIQASTDMKHWTPICTNVITGGSVTYTDAAAMTAPGRFYRAKLK